MWKEYCGQRRGKMRRTEERNKANRMRPIG
jgi:hypothetical protein